MSYTVCGYAVRGLERNKDGGRGLIHSAVFRFFTFAKSLSAKVINATVLCKFAPAAFRRIGLKIGAPRARRQFSTVGKNLSPSESELFRFCQACPWL